MARLVCSLKFDVGYGLLAAGPTISNAQWWMAACLFKHPKTRSRLDFRGSAQISGNIAGQSAVEEFESVSEFGRGGDRFSGLVRILLG